MHGHALHVSLCSGRNGDRRVQGAAEENSETDWTKPACCVWGTRRAVSRFDAIFLKQVVA